MSDPANDPPPRRRGSPLMVKGQASLNPNGRPPRGLSLAEHVRRAVDPDELIAFLLGIMRSSTAREADRLAAAGMLADRGWGKPLQPQAIDIQMDSRASSVLPAGWAELPRAEREKWIDAKRAQVLLAAGEDS